MMRDELQQGSSRHQLKPEPPSQSMADPALWMVEA
jgi:hypothetical protein